MIIIPLGHDDMVINRLPFVTIGLIVLCLVIYFPAKNKIESDRSLQAEKLARIFNYYQEHEYLKLPEKLLAKMPNSFVEIHEKRQDWVKWYLDSPKKVEAFLADEPEIKIDTEPVTGPLEELVAMMRSMPGSKMVQLEDVEKDLALSVINKKKLLKRVSSVGASGIYFEQSELDRLGTYLIPA